MKINKTGRMVGFHKLSIPKAKKQATQIPSGGSVIGGNAIKKPSFPVAQHGAFPKGLVC